MVTNETVDSPPDMLTDTDYLASEIHQVRSDIKEMAMDNRVNDVEQNKKLLEISNKLDAIEKSISKDNSKEIRSAGCQKEQESDMPVPRCEKEFVLKHVFKDVTNFKEDVYNDGGKEEHFNVNWYTAAKRHSNRLGLYVVCLPVSPSIKWSIQTKLELKAVGRNQNDVIKTRDHCYEESQGYGFSEFLEWEKMENEYLLDGNLTVEAKVTIIETSGFRKEENRKFDESNVSDVVLVVRDTKFHVLKAYLASQSSFFQSLFTENPTKSEFSSTGIDPNDFHCFLETLYGEYAIDDSNVEGVLLLADRLDSPMVKRRCEVFLLKESKKTLVKKQQMANCYHLQNWNFTCAITNANSKIKQFTMKTVFKKNPTIADNRLIASNKYGRKEYFNVNWVIKMQNLNNNLAILIHCEPISPKDKWSIQTNLELKAVGKADFTVTQDHCYELNTGQSCSKFMSWEKMENEYRVNGVLTVEAKVTIIETTGLGKEKIREFDESQKDVSDVILVVRHTKFYVSKTYLAAQSMYFKAILLGKSSDSEVELTGIDPNDFHYFLEVLYGEYAIDDSTVEGILMVADKCATQIVVRKCQEFLVNSSKKILSKKLELAMKYSLAELKNQCMSEIKTIADIQAVRNVHEMDPLITAALLEKSLYLR